MNLRMMGDRLPQANQADRRRFVNHPTDSDTHTTLPPDKLDPRARP